MARFETDAIAKSMRVAANYWDRRGIVSRAEKLRGWADELDPPTIKCTAHGCDYDALFRAELPASGDNPGMISFRCELHLVTWIGSNALLGTIKVGLL